MIIFAAEKVCTIMRKPVSVRLDQSVIDWFTLNGGNLNGVINRVMVCLVREAQRDSALAARITDKKAKYNYYHVV